MRGLERRAALLRREWFEWLDREQSRALGDGQRRAALTNLEAQLNAGLAVLEMAEGLLLASLRSFESVYDYELPVGMDPDGAESRTDAKRGRRVDVGGVDGGAG